MLIATSVVLAVALLCSIRIVQQLVLLMAIALGNIKGKAVIADWLMLATPATWGLFWFLTHYRG